MGNLILEMLHNETDAQNDMIISSSLRWNFQVLKVFHLICTSAEIQFTDTL